MLSKLRKVWALDPSRKRQWLRFKILRIKTSFFLRYRLQGCGQSNIVERPLFWTPERITLGNGCHVWPNCRIEGLPQEESGSSIAPHITLGDGVSMQQSCHITAAGRLSIGAGTLLSFNVSIQDTDHRYDDVTRSVSLQALTIAPTTIGENCFLGAGSRILAGTTLGRHCVVGAGSIVRGTFPDFSVIVGSPARVVKRYDPVRGAWRRTDAEGAFPPDPD